MKRLINRFKNWWDHWEPEPPRVGFGNGLFAAMRFFVCGWLSVWIFIIGFSFMSDFLIWFENTIDLSNTFTSIGPTTYIMGVCVLGTTVLFNGLKIAGE